MKHLDQNSDSMSVSTQLLPVTVMILTHNEQVNVGECLQYLDWTDDVIIIDSFSVDETLSIAMRQRPDVRIFQHRFEDFGQQRNWALEQTSPRHEWILFLDADERCNAECTQAIADAVVHPQSHVGFYLTCRNYFLGRWIRHCTIYPSWQLRLLKRGEVAYRKEGHGQREVTSGSLGYLQAPYDHYGFSKGVFHWIERHNKYSTEEVELIFRLQQEPLSIGDLLSADSVKRRRCLKRLAARIGFRPLLRFLYIYVWRGGFLDGKPGLVFSLLRVAQEIHILAKLAEAKFLQEAHRATSPAEFKPETAANELSHTCQFDPCEMKETVSCARH